MLERMCLYLHFDGVRYCFKKDPNVTLLVEQEADAVGRDERRVRERIKEMLEARLAGHRAALVWPEKSAEVPHKDALFLIAYLPLEFGAKTKSAQANQAIEFFEKHGDQPRQYRNGIGLAVPSGDQIEILRRAVRYLIAVEQVKVKAKQHNLTDEQKSQLREREATEKAAAESALLKLYTEVWLPRAEAGRIGVETVAVGGRPLGTTLNEKKEAMIHERVIELIKDVQPRVFSTVTPGKIIELFQLGDGAPPKLGCRTQDIVDGFYSFLGFTRLFSSAVIRKAVARGVQEGAFGYMAGPPPQIGPDGKYQVPLAKIRLGVALAEDEIDLDSGFVIMPQAIPLPAPPPTGQPIEGPPLETISGGNGEESSPPPPVLPGMPIPAPAAAPQQIVELSFSADRNQLFNAWNAVANLADLAGKVSVTLRAQSEKGFDRGKLQNGVIEPLREADLIE
jgi:hypothetical protein